MQNHKENAPDEKSLTSGLYNKTCLIIWGLLLLGIVGGLGQGPLMLNVARLALIGMVAMFIPRLSKPQKISLKVFVIAEVSLLGILVGSGLKGGNDLIVALGAVIVAWVIVSSFIIWIDRRLGLRTY